jgi:glucokinase-like ROK family protein
MLALNPQGGFVIGIKLMEGTAVGALTDLNANIVAKDSAQLDSIQVDANVEALTKLTNSLLLLGGIRKKQLLGVGIGLAGVVDFSHGIIRQNPFLGWKDIPLRNMLQNKLRVPVYIDNDVNTLTLGEKWLHSGEQEDNFIVITLGRGIGMGIVINGQIYRGKSGGAGEFGHTIVEPNGPLCDCGKQGCLESIIGDAALVNTARNEVSPTITHLGELIERAKSGEPEAVQVLARAGTILGRQMANIVNILDPKLIIISGEGTCMGEIFFAPMRLAFHKNVMPGLAEDTEIRVKLWGNDIWALGAASLVIAEIFNPPALKEERKGEIQ